MPVNAKQNSESYNLLERPLDISLLNRLISEIENTQHRTIFQTFLETGIKPLELFSLKPKDYDLENHSLRISNKKRTVTLSNQLNLEIQKLAAHKKLFLFQTTKRPQLNKVALHRIFDKYSKQWNIKITPSLLRKFNITHRLANKTAHEVKDEVGLNRLATPSVIPTEKVHHLYTAAAVYHSAIIQLILETACTVSELQSLKKQNISKENNTITFEKECAHNKKQRTVSTSKELTSKLLNISKNNHEYVFENSNETTFSKERFYHLLKKLGKQIDCKLNAQTLRHTSISNQLHKGSSISEVMSSTGLKSLDQFHLYSNLYAINNNG